MTPARPIGYVEVQRALPGKAGEALAASIAIEVIQEVTREHPGMIYYGMRIEHTLDGASLWHTIVYYGFVPKIQTTPPLDPRNMNEAPAAPIGGIPVEDILPLGTKELKFWHTNTQ